MPWWNEPGGAMPGGMPATRGTATTGTLPGAMPAWWTAAYGGVPRVPSPATTQAGALGADIGSLAQLYGLTTAASAAGAAGARGQLEANLPGYTGMIGQSSANILSRLRGEVPLDVSRAIAQGAAERGAATGMGAGAPATNAALLRALGLTSLGLQETGEQELTGAIARTPRGPAFDPSRFLLTPEQMQEAQLAANIYGAAPSPSAAAAEAVRLAQAGAGAGMGMAGPRVSGIGTGLLPGSEFRSTWASDVLNPPAGGALYPGGDLSQFPQGAAAVLPGARDWSNPATWGQADYAQYPADPFGGATYEELWGGGGAEGLFGGDMP